MKSITLIAALALPLAACSSTPKGSAQASIPPGDSSQFATETNTVSMAPIERVDQGSSQSAMELDMFDVFGLDTSAMAASGPETMADVAGALASQDRERLVNLCSQDMPSAFVLPRGTWMQVIAVGSESVQYGDQMLDVELVTCEIIDGPNARQIGQSVTMPVRWLEGRIVRDAQ